MIISFRSKKIFHVGTVLLIILVACVYLRSGSPFSLAYQALSLQSHIFLTAVLLCIWGLRRKKQICGFAAACAVVFCISVLATMIRTKEIYAYRVYVVQVLFCVSGYLLVVLVSMHDFVKIWIKTMRAVVVCALLMYVLVALGFKSFPTIVTSRGNAYYTMLICSQLITDSRLAGASWEPSMYAAILSFTLYLELMYNYKSGERRFFIALEIISLLLTGSISAIVYIVLLTYVYMSKTIRKEKNRIVYMLFTFAIIVVVSTSFEPIIYSLYQVFPKIFYKFVNRDISFLTRLYNPIGDILTCIQYPFGAGIENVESIVKKWAQEYTQLSYVVVSRTSTWSYYFAAFGVVSGVSANAIWIYGIWNNKKMYFTQKICLTIMMLYALSSVTLINNQMYWAFIMFLCVISKNSSETECLC